MAPRAKVKKPRAVRRKKAAPTSRGLDAVSVGQERPDLDLIREIEADGGSVIGVYREPLGGTPVVMAALPIDRVAPTPFQRDRSETHTKRLASAMEKVGRFLDPIIAVRDGGTYYTPNGSHRLGAMGLLGMKSIVALVIPDPNVAYTILALNTEKAHNLKERSLEVIRIARGLLPIAANKDEADFLDIFDEPQFLTLGAAYEKRPRFSAGAFSPVVRRVEGFLKEPLRDALKIRDERADLLLAWDDEVVKVVAALKAQGLTSPYLKNFVVAKVNYLRFKRDGDFDFEETVEKMMEATKKIDAQKIDRAAVAALASAGSGGDEE